MNTDRIKELSKQAERMASSKNLSSDGTWHDVFEQSLAKLVANDVLEQMISYGVISKSGNIYQELSKTFCENIESSCGTVASQRTTIEEPRRLRMR